MLRANVLFLQSSSEFHPPFVLELRHTQKTSTHHGDDNAGDEAENALPDVFGVPENILLEAIEGANEAASDAEAEE